MRLPHTLFARLFLVQTVTSAALVALFMLFFYIDRSSTVGRLVGQRWASVLHAAAAGAPVSTSEAAARLAGVRRQLRQPEDLVYPNPSAPRVAALREALRLGGVAAEEVALTRSGGEALVWIRVRVGSELVWLGFADDLVEPRLAWRLLGITVLVLAVTGAVSWLTARWLTRPLHRLGERMAAHDPGSSHRTLPAEGGETEHESALELAAIEAAWWRLHERLGRHERERRLLLAGVSHDMRSPLARIRMAAELLPSLHDVAVRRDVIVRNVDLADRLLQSFLDQVRAELLPLDESVDVAALGRSMVESRTVSRDDLCFEGEGMLWLRDVNRLLLERAMQNLLDNAFNHGRPPVVLRVTRDREGVCIEVEDTGPGVPADARDHLVEAFARGDPSRHVAGTGLGLTVVAQVAQRLGGALTLDGQPGAHRARLRLPARLLA